MFQTRDANLKALLDSVRSENGLGQHYLDPKHPAVQTITGLAKQIGAKQILDLGTGRGLTALAIAREAAPEAIVASDINAPGIDELRRTAAAGQYPIEAITFDAGNSCAPDHWRARFDLAVAKDLYPFLAPQEIDQLFKTAALTLKPGGHFIFTAPLSTSRLYRESEPTANPLYTRLSQSGKEFVQTSGDYFSYVALDSVAEQIAKYGFKLESTETFGRERGWLTVIAKRAD